MAATAQMIGYGAKAPQDAVYRRVLELQAQALASLPEEARQVLLEALQL